jgi:uncharacterized membrane protein
MAVSEITKRPAWYPHFLWPKIIVRRQADGVAVTVNNEFPLLAPPVLLLLILFAAGVTGAPGPLAMLRLLLGLAFVLLVPGYALQAAFFPSRDDLDGPERLALAFGLSLALVPPIALVLDRLPWGIRPWPILIAECACAVAAAVAAVYRRGRLPEGERFIFAFEMHAGGWWRSQDRTARRLYALLAAALAMFAVAASAILFVPHPSDRFTEFYVLGSGGLAENYPREAAAGQPVSVTLGIVNREGAAAQYRAEARSGGQTLAQVGPLQLGAGQASEVPLSFAPPGIGDDVQTEFLLYRDGGTEPYRRLLLWMKVMPPGAAGRQ